ncbi:HNH endonuclease [Bacillus sp. sid0103]|uniref:HNH endonuclease signature motif containing protein n=1 Tax=Bacillus sp. sid0103 TaxID=2856337 RepID=UPI001C46E327|nr:HNH endonuclease signature motif containing protein [Bacillus sp. sid0103]MBV7504697.1 HNH endonuclease [Bacillus sp. sid0103]
MTKQMGMTKEIYDHIIKNIDKLEADFERGLVRNKKTKKVYDTCVNGVGYRPLSLGGKQVYAHQIIAVVVYGERCIGRTVHHLNEIRTDNRWNNLALVSHGDNVRLKKDTSSKGKQPIIARHIDTGHEHVFESQLQASKCMGIAQGKINTVLQGRVKQTDGWTFERI